MSLPPISPADLSDYASALRVALLLDQMPVGVRLERETGLDACPRRRRPETPLLYCEAVARAGGGECFRLEPSDIACDTAPLILGMFAGFRDEDFVASYADCGLYPDTTVAATMLSTVETLHDVKALTVAPLDLFGSGSGPDVVIVTATPYGAMRLVQGAGYRGLLARCSPIGMHGVCAESTVAPYLSGQISLSLLCSNGRYGTHWDENSVAVGLPAAILSEVVHGLLQTMQSYETDERKEAIRAALGAHESPWPVLAESVNGLESGRAYYLEGRSCRSGSARDPGGG